MTALLGEHRPDLKEAGKKDWQPPALPRQTLAGRIWRAAWRLTRAAIARLLHPRVSIGPRCDIRRRLHLQIGEHGTVQMGAECIIDHDAVIEAYGRIDIGARTIFGHHCTVAAQESIFIGEDCLIAEMVSIRDHDHRFDRLDIPVRMQGSISSPIHIGRNVWIGAKATITRGVKIGDNAIIGANAVVTRDIPANAIAVGTPARVQRLREG